MYGHSISEQMFGLAAVTLQVKYIPCSAQWLASNPSFFPSVALVYHQWICGCLLWSYVEE
jgi:hypothetical protein